MFIRGLSISYNPVEIVTGDPAIALLKIRNVTEERLLSGAQIADRYGQLVRRLALEAREQVRGAPAQFTGQRFFAGTQSDGGIIQAGWSPSAFS
jgi:hypothetical protein